jgi:hypothetical protein
MPPRILTYAVYDLDPIPPEIIVERDRVRVVGYQSSLRSS